MTEFKEFYYDLLAVWEDVFPDKPFHIYEHSPQPAIAQLVNEYNEQHRTDTIALKHEGLDWYIEDEDCPRLLDWYRGFISESKQTGK